ncbi:trigger factor [Propionivibrio sp.]|uniref:trigger factor n=1 Tax=Propionivibrio sp. TaxID=2212460 RepID=UPI0025E0644A|nr:trigger factor [Propionivibrio sp.]MBK7356774.1 trigger factor [Propionivibrio sp.]MBK8744542.1 trigger factor [Propionivibrio sp.]
METNAAITNAEPEATQRTNALERRLDLAVPIADLDREIEQRLRRISKNVKMPGFRPGKVPATIVKQQYGEQARHEALNDALERVFGETVNTQQLRVAGHPSIEPKTSESSTHIEFSAVFEVYPEIKLGDLKDVNIERPALAVGAAEMESTLTALRKQRVSFEPVDRPAAPGDRVTVDFLGKKDGEPFQGGQASDYHFVIGEGTMLADFESAVAGLRAGEEKSFEMTFPADYSAKDLAGQKVTFSVTVKEVREPVLPEIDADFAKSLGVENGDIDQMTAEIEANLKREVKKRLHGRIKDQVMDALLKANPIDVPNALVDMEIQRLMQAARQDMEQRTGGKMKDFPLQPEWFVDQARRRVSLGLILSEIVKVNELHAKSDQVKAIVDEAAQSYEHPEEVVRWYYAQPQRLAEIEGVAIEDNVVAWALTHARVVDQPVDFDQLMGQKS